MYPIHSSDVESRHALEAPHEKVEEALGAVLGDAPCAVTAVPDGARGERLVALYVKPELTSGGPLGAPGGHRPAAVMAAET